MYLIVSSCLLNKTSFSDAISNGGFGPVVNDGFGVGYATTDDSIGFMVSSYKSYSEHENFIRSLKRALQDIRDCL